ncbi:LOW QUALITY PROTEIN: cytochrome P450 1B1 [Pholidichthys leucotaenia]
MYLGLQELCWWPAATLLLTLHLFRWLQRRPTYPPGPFSWPHSIWNARQLGNGTHLYFMRMIKYWGNVLQIKLGKRKVVVLEQRRIKQALVNQGAEFSRAGPDLSTSFPVCPLTGTALPFGNSSDWWGRWHRKVAQSTVRNVSPTVNPQTKKAFENHIMCECGKSGCKLFLRKNRGCSGTFQPMTYLVVSTANIMSAVCFGKRYSYDDEEFRQIVGRNDQFTQTVGAGSIVDVMPWLQYFPNPIKTMFNNFKKLNKEFNEFIRDKVVTHRKTMESGSIRDMTDALIVALDELRDRVGLPHGKDYVAASVGDVFGASQDTLSTSLQWIILVLVKFPEVQKRLQQEVDKVVDRSRIPSIEDQARLPYVMAFIYEVMRFTSFVPLTIPHSTTTDTSIMGYTVPKNTVIFINQWSLNHDPASWSNPETFDPERFLDQSGALNKDLTSRVLLFSLGKRRCIGEELSKLKLFLFTALLAHQCNFTADPGRPLTFDYCYGLTLKPQPFNIAMSLRDNMEALEASTTAASDEEKKRHS